MNLDGHRQRLASIRTAIINHEQRHHTYLVTQRIPEYLETLNELREELGAAEEALLLAEKADEAEWARAAKTWAVQA